MEELVNWLLGLNRFSALAGCLFYFYTKQSLKSVSGIVFLILLFSFIADNLVFFYIRLVYPNSYVIGNIWIIVNYLLMIWLFRQLLQEQFKKLLLILAGLFISGTIISFFYFSINEANTFINLFSDVTIIMLALITYLQLLKNPSHKLVVQPVFWIATSLFIHSSLVLLQNVFDNYLIFDQEISKGGYQLILIINLIANSTKNFILFYSLVLIKNGFPDKVSMKKIS